MRLYIKIRGIYDVNYTRFYLCNFPGRFFCFLRLPIWTTKLQPQSFPLCKHFRSQQTLTACREKPTPFASICHWLIFRRKNFQSAFQILHAGCARWRSWCSFQTLQVDSARKWQKKETGENFWAYYKCHFIILI